MTHVKIGWSPKEIIWLRAALTLPAFDCIRALDDIRSLSGRTLSAVRAKAEALKGENDPPPRKRKAVYAKGLFVPAESVPLAIRARPRAAEG